MNSDREDDEGRRRTGTTSEPRKPWHPPKLTFATISEDTGGLFFTGSDGFGPTTANS
jgi:hypothetical protein